MQRFQMSIVPSSEGVITAGAATDMCATVDINAFIIGGFLTIDGTIASAMVNAEPATALPLAIGMDIPLILPIGTVDMSLANSDPTTGQVVWHMRYIYFFSVLFEHRR